VKLKRSLEGDRYAVTNREKREYILHPDDTLGCLLVYHCVDFTINA
jgi:hypothetical protein